MEEDGGVMKVVGVAFGGGVCPFEVSAGGTEVAGMFLGSRCRGGGGCVVV
jgi:hypothetical protein